MKMLGLNFQKLAGGFQFASTVPGSVGSFQLAPSGLILGSSLPLSQAFNVLLNDSNSGYAGVISALSSVNQVIASEHNLALGPFFLLNTALGRLCLGLGAGRGGQPGVLRRSSALSVRGR